MEDLALLFNHFLIKLNDKYDKSVLKMSPELLRFFQNYPWPGNIREFANVMEGMIILAEKETLGISDLPLELRNFFSNRNKLISSVKDITPGLSMAEYEKLAIIANLNFFNKNRKKTAKSLGIAERSLYRKIKEYEIED